MKTNKIKKDFNPVNLTLETEEELNFLWSLASIGGAIRKDESKNWNSHLDNELFEVLDRIKK